MNNSTNKFAVIFGFVVVIVILAAQFLYFSNMIEGDAGMSDEDFNAKVEAGIDAYVEKQMKAQQENVPAQPEPLDEDAMAGLSDDDPVKGDENAPVTIVEFSEYECPFCGKFYNEAYQEILTKYVETGKVKMVFRDYPLPFHSNALPAAIAANCAREQGGDEAYFDMHDSIFANQGDLSDEAFVLHANEMGIDADKFTACVADNDYEAEIQKDIKDGQAVGVNGTPAFFINGEFLSGAQPFANFEKIIEAKLAE